MAQEILDQIKESLKPISDKMASVNAELAKMKAESEEQKTKLGSVDGVLKEQMGKLITEKGLLTDEMALQIKEINQQETDKAITDLKAQFLSGGFNRRKTAFDEFNEKTKFSDIAKNGNNAILDKFLNKTHKMDGSWVNKDYTPIDPVYSDVAGSVGQNVRLTRDPSIKFEPLRNLAMSDILPVIPLTGGSLEIDRVKFFGDISSGNSQFGGADYQLAQGDIKSQSVLKMEKITYTPKDIATWLPASRQSLDDVNGLQQLIGMFLPYSVQVKTNKAILNDSGVSGELEGINTIATAVSNVAGDNILDTVSRGFQLIQENDYTPGADYLVMNTADFWNFQRAKDGEQRYLFGDPKQLGGARIWGVPIVIQNDQPVGTWLAGNFAMGSQLRPIIGSAGLRMSDNVGIDFLRNRLVWLAEERVILANHLPSAYAKGNFIIPS